MFFFFLLRKFKIKKDEKVKMYFRKIDDIGQNIEGMESSVDYLSVTINRIGSIFKNLKIF